MTQVGADTPDVLLVHSLRGGNQEALRILYDRYGDLVYTIALRILNRQDEAEDLTQEVFLTFWRQENYQPQKASLSTYLSIITRSRGLNRLRTLTSQQRSVERLQTLMLQDAAAPSPLEQASLYEQREILRQVMTQLPENQQRVLEMSYFQDFSQSEIARQLNLPLGTVKTTARQGLIRLRQILGEAVGA